jgi:hypothetical protein
MPLPSFLISANIFICEKVLIETDSVLSFVRMIDVFVPSGDTSKPANEGHLKTGQQKTGGTSSLYPVMAGESKKKFGNRRQS